MIYTLHKDNYDQLIICFIYRRKITLFLIKVSAASLSDFFFFFAIVGKYIVLLYLLIY